MEKELTSAEKARKTKLSNKSVEELVEVIFRKDNTEKRLQKLNKCLKANIVGLENKCNKINDELAQKEDEIINLQEDIKDLKEINNINLVNYEHRLRNNNIIWAVTIIALIIVRLIVESLF